MRIARESQRLLHANPSLDHRSKCYNGNRECKRDPESTPKTGDHVGVMAVVIGLDRAATFMTASAVFVRRSGASGPRVMMKMVVETLCAFRLVRMMLAHS